MTVEQVAKDFGVHPMTLWKWRSTAPALPTEAGRGPLSICYGAGAAPTHNRRVNS
ncbi:helix-turn-helix domain-containing protein [Streptomyces sp. Act143]|uniref:helix-turn-helix domain-containing protein n=1 Tax=Streptomyces sp. Act143 TaxID=2200760 RepID=UPI001C6344A0